MSRELPVILYFLIFRFFLFFSVIRDELSDPYDYKR